MSSNETTPNTIVARHPGVCAECGGYFQVGDTITRPNPFAQWRHGTCPRTRFDFNPADVCPECFTVRATTGACNCA